MHTAFVIFMYREMKSDGGDFSELCAFITFRMFLNLDSLEVYLEKNSQ